MGFVEKSRVGGGGAGLLGAAFLLIPRGGYDVFLALRKFRTILISSSTATTACLGLRVIALKRLGFNEENISFGRSARVLCGGIQTDHVSGNQLEILQCQGVFAARRLDAALREQIDGFIRAGVDRVMQGHLAQAEIVVRRHFHRNLFNRRRLEIAAWPYHFDGRWIVLASFNKIIVRETNVFSALNSRYVIHAVFIDGNAGCEPVAILGSQCQLPIVAKHEHPFGERPVREHGNCSLRAFHGAQVPAGLFRCIRHAGPRRKMIRDADLLDARQIHHFQRVVFGLHRTGFHVIFDGIR